MVNKVEFELDNIQKWTKEYLEKTLSEYDPALLDGEIRRVSLRKVRKGFKKISRALGKDYLEFIDIKIRDFKKECALKVINDLIDNQVNQGDNS